MAVTNDDARICTPLVEPAAPRARVRRASVEAESRSMALTRSVYLARRIWRVLCDLHLDRALRGSIVPTETGLTIVLTLKQADALALRLEDLVADRPSGRARPGPGQLSLF
jgi:hypothetical protein